MKRLISILLSVTIIITSLTTLSISANAEVKILNSLSMNVGGTKPLNFTDLQGNPVSVNWVSYDTSIATVDSAGKVTGKKAGSTILSTVYNSKEYGISLTFNAVAAKKTTAKNPRR